MTDQWPASLSAFIDGELEADQVARLEAHLQNCESCRRDLRELQALREILQSYPYAEGLSPQDDFVRSVVRQLPTRPNNGTLTGQDVFRLLWRAMPFGLAGVWAICQAVLVSSGIVWLGFRTGLLDSRLFTFFATSLSPSRGLGATMSGAFADSLTEIVGWAFDTLSPLVWIGLGYFAVLCSIGLLYWCWLASWWMRHNSNRLVTADV